MCAAIAARPVRVAVGWTGRRAEWIALNETAKGKGASLVGRGPLLRGRMILEHWVRARASDASSSSDSVQAAKREIARIECAILEGGGGGVTTRSTSTGISRRGLSGSSS